MSESSTTGSSSLSNGMISFLFMDTERVWRGGQDQLLTLLRGLRQRGHRVHLICHPQTLLDERAREAGLHVHPVSIRSEIGPVAFFRVLAVLLQTHPQVLAFNTPKPVLLGNLASRFAGVKSRIIFRRVNFPFRRNAFTRLKYRWGIDCVVAISESIRSQLLAGGVQASRIRTIYEGMDLSRYPRLDRPARHVAGDPVIVGTVAHLSPEKGLAYLVRAAARIQNVCERIRFVVVGDGACRKDLESEVHRRGLQACFDFRGFQSNPAELLYQFDIFVLPSLSEGLSSAILTAMATSLPVVATDVGGIPELVKHGVNGMLVPPADAEALARAIEKLAKDSEQRLRMGRAGRILMEERFTLERKISETEQLCASLLEEAMSAGRRTDV